ncbi:hypothetical protein BGZ75_010040 [Mortierella antarctica]|nr:hypothetical protein BGZ75_010040 [Mortierella antarctica]
MFDDQTEVHPIRVELDASVVLHRGTYQIEFALSEENSTYQTPSPSATLHVFDALFHNVVTTFVPEPSTADIWFEFPTPNDDRQPIAFVGAHEQVLSKYKDLSEWIERERQEREEQRREQLEEEWRIHQHLQWGQEQERAGVTVQGIGQQGPRGMTPIGPRIGHQFERHVDHSPFRSQHRGASLSSISESASSSLLPTRLSTPPHASQPPRPSTLSRGQVLTPAPQVQLRYQPQSLPVLRISVMDISLEVFQVLLQYLYTGGMTLSDTQKVEVEDYWSLNPETHHCISQEESRTRAQDEGERKIDAPKACIPILLPSLGSSDQGSDASFPQQQQQQGQQPPQDQPPPKSFTAPLDSWPDPNLYSLPRPDHHSVPPQVYRHHHEGQPGCSWEDLLLAANKLHLKRLQGLAMRALQYRYQMLAVQASLNNSVIAEVAHNGFDETRLDVQLALGEEILRSLLSLYNNQSSKHEDEVEEWMGARAVAAVAAATGRHEATNEPEGDDETEDEDMVVKKEVLRVGRMVEEPVVSSYQAVRTNVLSPALLRTGAPRAVPVPFPIELSTLSSPRGTTREHVRVIQEHMERSIEAASATSPSTPLPSGQDNDDRAEQIHEDGFLDDPECEHAILDLCKEIRSRFLRMRDIMEPSRH